jgi:hypothetical protein
MTIRISPLKLTVSVITIAAASALFAGTAFAEFASDPLGDEFINGSLSISGAINEPLFAGHSVVPGDQDMTSVTVQNKGTLDLRYAVVSTTTEDTLAGRLELSIWQADTGAACASPTSRPLYGPAALGSVSGISIVGDPAQGSQAGDRTLAAGAVETLCFKVSAPLSLDNSFQGLTTQPTFHFDAEQVDGNP